MKPCDNIRSHLSALVDGELEPFEAIAVRRHLDQCPACNREYRGLERLKVAVHVSGTQESLSAHAHTRMRESIRTWAGRDQTRERARRWWLPAAAVAAAAALVLSLLLPGGGDDSPELSAADSSASATVPLDRSTLERLVHVHRFGTGRDHLEELAQTGALMAYERLPDSFIHQSSDSDTVVQASFPNCVAPQPASSLIVMRAGRLNLDPAIADALETRGVFLDVVEGVEVRVSESGDKVFVLLKEPRLLAQPI